MFKRILSIFLSSVILASLMTPVSVNASTQMQAGLVTTNGGGLYVRADASAGSAVLARLQPGSYITLRSRQGSWWQVEYANGRYGYCHADYIKPQPGNPAAVATNGGNLNVRSGSGTSYTIADRLRNGEPVFVLSESQGWSRILYHGIKTGYVSSKYLSSGSAYPRISLSVPSFKQTDSRWANITLGSSGKTMAKIGCATTAIAMMESYRTGTTIYPHTMANSLRYTASGSVYWPSHFTVNTRASGYLSHIYSLLKMGKPILFGATNSAGGQHWVVITGFKGGPSLTASGFTINDPADKSRTTLADLYSDYPNFYKFFYYNN